MVFCSILIDVFYKLGWCTSILNQYKNICRSWSADFCVWQHRWRTYMMAASTEELCCSMLYAAGPCSQVFLWFFSSPWALSSLFEFPAGYCFCWYPERAKSIQHLSGVLLTWTFGKRAPRWMYLESPSALSLWLCVFTGKPLQWVFLNPCSRKILAALWPHSASLMEVGNVATDVGRRGISRVHAGHH